MDKDPSENGAAANDGMPSPSPGKALHGSGKKTKKQKGPQQERMPPQDGASAQVGTPAASATPKKTGENPPGDRKAGDTPASAKKVGENQPVDKKTADTPTGAKKPKSEKKPQGQAPEQGQGQKKGQGPEHQGLGQSDGAQGDVVLQKNKAELRAERRAKQEAQRAAKPGKKPEAPGGEKQKVEAAKRVHPKVLQDDPNMEKKVERRLVKQNVPVRTSSGRKVALFNHLHQHDRNVNHLMDLQVWSSGGECTRGIHPAVMRLGLKYLNYSIVGSDARAVGILSAFDQAIADYEVPENKEFCRDIDAPLSRYISFLNGCRPLSVSMGNAIKFVKWKISQLTAMPDIPEAEARGELRKGIQKFLDEKIQYATDAVALYCSELFSHGDVIIVYGFSSVVLKVLRKVSVEKQGIKVLVVDNRPKHEGKEMLRRLRDIGVDCAFVPLNMAAIYIRAIKNGSLVGQIQSKDRDIAHHAQGAQNCKVLFGAHGVLNNAYVMSRVGTAMLGAIAKAHNIEVLVCFATYKISDRSQCDSFVFNELGNPDELVKVDHQDPMLPKPWQDLNTLCLLNLMYDVMAAACVSTYVTEIRSIPATAIPKVMNSRVSLYET